MTATPLHIYTANPTDLLDLLDRAALDVIDGVDLDDVTEEVVATYCGPAAPAGTVPNPARLGDALVELVEGRMNDLIGVDCLLDEVAQRSYDATGKMARILIAEITAQDNVSDAVLSLARTEIADRVERAETLSRGC